MGFFHWLFGKRQNAKPTPPVAFQHYVTMEVPQSDIGGSPVVISAAAGPAFSAETNTLPPTSAPPPDLELSEVGFESSLFIDPRGVANLQSLMREADVLPIGSVPGHAVAHLKVDYLRGRYFLNGKCASLEELRRDFARLGHVGGLVFYYKENPTVEMPPEAEAALAAICEARLPVAFAVRDYDPAVKVADYFLPEGAW
jgi:hypothetical protein